MLKKLIEFSNSKKLEIILSCLSYIGLIGFIIYFLLRIFDKENNEELIYHHSKNSSILFLISIFAIPFATLINSFYFYLLNPMLNIILIFTYIFVIHQKMKGIKNALYGKEYKIFI